MDNALGLRVESSIPGKFATGISISSELNISFNSELNTRTIPNNVLILKDTRNQYVDNMEINVNNYEIVEGAITYRDKSIFFTSTNQLDKNSRYIIYVRKESVSDILGNLMLTDYIASFTTETYDTFTPCDILEPLHNSIISSLDKILIEDVDSYRYIYQISKQPTFENVILEEISDSNEIVKSFNIGDGLYYLRAKAENGERFGEAIIFSIKSYSGTTTTDQDIDDAYIYEPFEDESLEIISSYPDFKSTNVNVKTNIMYMKFNKLIPLGDIDFYEAEIIGAFSDSDDLFNNESAKEHGELDGSFNVIYDEENVETYIFFTPEIM